MFSISFSLGTVFAIDTEVTVNGCTIELDTVAFCSDREDVNSMSLTVVHSLIDKYDISVDDIGRLEIGTATMMHGCESISRTLMNFFIDIGNTELEGSTSMDSYHGGTTALYHALHWVDSSAWDGRFALVVTVDVADYIDSPHELRSGCGAVAMLIGRDAPLSISLKTKVTRTSKLHEISEVGELNSRIYEKSYLEALGRCYTHFVDKVEHLRQTGHIEVTSPENVDHFIFDCSHVELLRKSFNSVANLGRKRSIRGSHEHTAYNINKSSTESIDPGVWNGEKVLSSYLLSRCIGNTNTASLYMNLANLVSLLGSSINGESIILFSYGAGIASMFSICPRHTGNKFTLSRMQVCLNIFQRLSSRLSCCHRTKNLALICNEASHVHVPYDPKFPVSHLHNNTYFLKSITPSNRRVYERLHRQNLGTNLRHRYEDITLPQSAIIDIESYIYPEGHRSTPGHMPMGRNSYKMLNKSEVESVREDEHTFSKGLTRNKTYVWASGRPNVNVVVTGVAAALPGRHSSVFKPGVDSIQRIIDGENFITEIPENVKVDMLDKNVVQVRKNKDGTVSRIPIVTFDEGINLCASIGEFDLTVYGVSASIVNTMDRSEQVAVAAGLEALKDAGMVSGIGEGMNGWVLPDYLQNSTGVVYATSFPALDAAIEEVSKYFMTKSFDTRKIQEIIGSLRNRLSDAYDVSSLSSEAERALQDLEKFVSSSNESMSRYEFDRKFLFRVLVLGNAQLAQIIKARGPNMQTNAACAGATQAVALAYDMIQVGRAERMIIIAGDNASSDNLMPWLGNGFRALGAATSCANVKLAALPFDKRRTGMILGSGGIGMILESEEGAKRRHYSGQNPHRVEPFRCRLLGTLISNSAYHGASMDMKHISQEMERFIGSIEKEHGITRRYK